MSEPQRCKCGHTRTFHAASFGACSVCACDGWREPVPLLPVAAPETGTPPILCESGDCGRAATCFGVYECETDPLRFACDTCCGHGCEDGWCKPIAELAAYARKLHGEIQVFDERMEDGRIQHAQTCHELDELKQSLAGEITAQAASDLLAWLNAKQKHAERWIRSESGILRFALTAVELRQVRNALETKAHEAFTPKPFRQHDRTCPVYGNYQPPYEICDCGVNTAPAPETAALVARLRAEADSFDKLETPNDMSALLRDAAAAIARPERLGDEALELLSRDVHMCGDESCDHCQRIRAFQNKLIRADTPTPSPAAPPTLCAKFGEHVFHWSQAMDGGQCVCGNKVIAGRRLADHPSAVGEPKPATPSPAAGLRERLEAALTDELLLRVAKIILRRDSPQLKVGRHVLLDALAAAPAPTDLQNESAAEADRRPNAYQASDSAISPAASRSVDLLVDALKQITGYGVYESITMREIASQALARWAAAPAPTRRERTKVRMVLGATISHGANPYCQQVGSHPLTTCQALDIAFPEHVSPAAPTQDVIPPHVWEMGRCIRCGRPLSEAHDPCDAIPVAAPSATEPR